MKGKENNLAAGKQWKTGNLNPSQRISCHPLPPTWLIHPPVFRLIGSRIHSPLPLPDSISRLIKDRWPERNTPTEILSIFLPFYRKTRNEEFVSEEFRETSKSIMIFFFLQWFGKKGETLSMRKLQFAERRSNSRLGHLIVNRENWAPLLGEIGGREGVRLRYTEEWFRLIDWVHGWWCPEGRCMCLKIGEIG